MTESTATAQRALHARPASILSRAAAQFTSEVVLVAGDRSANAKSVLSLMALDVDAGAELIVRASGEDEAQAVKVMRGLIEDTGEPDG